MIATSEPDRVICELSVNNVPATVIGEFTEQYNDDKIRLSGGEIRELLPPGADEIYKI